MQRKKIGRDLVNGPIFKSLILFSIPIILTNIIQQLYSMADLAIVGKYVGNIGTVGVSTGGEISDIMTPLATAFAMSGQILISQLIGLGNRQKANRAVGTLLSIMLLVSIVFAAGTIVFSNDILNLLNCPSEAFSQAKAYLIITSIGMPFIFGYNGMCGVLRGMGESKKPLIFIIVAASINVVTDILFVAVFRLEAAGTAIATVLSQLGSFIASFVFLYRHKEEMNFELDISYFSIDAELAKKIVTLAIPQMTRQLLVRFSMLWVNSNINAYGLIASATNSIGNKIQKFMEVFISGVDSASSSMVGQNLGARKPERAKKTVLYTFGFCMVVAVVSSIMFVAIPKTLYSVFTDEIEVMNFGVEYLKIMVMTIFVSGFTGSFQTMVTGSGFVSLSFALGILDGIVARIGFSLLFLKVFNMGVYSFFWGTAFSRTITGLVVFIYFLSGKWAKRKLVTE